MTTIGINTYAYAWTTPAIEAVRRLADIGYRSFELLLHPPHLELEDYSKESRRELAALFRQVGAAHCSLNLPSLDHNMASPWPNVREFTLDLFRQTVDLASDLDIPYIVVVPGRLSPLAPANVETRTIWVRDSLERLLPHAQSRGVKLAVENIPMAAFPDAASLGDFVRSFNSPDLGVCYDAANAHYYGESPATGLRELADLVRIVHVSDTTRRVWKHDPVGTGDVPFSEIPEALAEIAFDGAVMLEILAPDPQAAIITSHELLAKVGFPARNGAVAR